METQNPWLQRGGKQREFFAYRAFVPDNVDLARFCLAILAPPGIGPGHEVFEMVLADLFHRYRSRERLRPNEWSRLLATWIERFQLNLQHLGGRLSGKNKADRQPDDRHVIEEVFKQFSRQYSAAGLRVGPLDCHGLSIVSGSPNWTGPAVFSKRWARLNVKKRRQVRFQTQLIKEDFANTDP